VSGPTKALSVIGRARHAYLQYLHGLLTGISFYAAEKSVLPNLGVKTFRHK